MSHGFPSTPTAPTWVRLSAVAIGLVGLVAATRVTITSARWIGRTFPGFLLLENRVIPSVGLAHWSGSGIPDFYQSELLAVDGRPVASVAGLYEPVAATAPGTLVRYRVRKDGLVRELSIATQRFTARDWGLLFGAYLMNAAVYLASGLVVWVLRPHSPLARAFLVFGIVWAAFFITAMDIYGPGTFTRVHTVTEALTGAAVVQMGMLFPQPHRWAAWRFAGYVPALALAVAYELWFDDPRTFSAVVMLGMLYLGGAGVLLGLRLIASYWTTTSPLARQRVRIVALGTLFGLGLPGAVLALSAAAWGEVEMNFVVYTTFLFAASVAYAIVKHDLFELDAMVKRGAYYLVLTGAVGAAYVAAVVLFNAFLPNRVTTAASFPVLFTLAVVLVFNPLRDRLQTLVDGVFFRTRYDASELLAALGGALASALTRETIALLVRESVEQAIPNGGTRLFARTAGQAVAECGGSLVMGPALVRQLGAGRAVTAFDAVEVYADPEELRAVREALLALGAEVAIPLDPDGTSAGALTVGPKRSGLFYTAGDAEFLRAVAHQAGIALANAAKYEEIVRLNATLEERVRERTAELERTNRELGAAYRELQAAQVQLVHTEKMAGLGRLVAGVAHEINNPVSFISTSVGPLKRRLERARTMLPPGEAQPLADAADLVDLMARGAERTAAIVRDLRSFSRLGEADRKAADLLDGIEVSIRLLESRWRGRLTIHRDLAPLPVVECDPGQMNQVFMNLLANACDAAPDGGNVWVTARAADGHAVVSVRDDGPGIPADVQDRVFEPFFTTKDAGNGTGLGLAIARRIVAGHGGRLELESRPGAGTTFRIVLPTTRGDVPAERAATG